jgi:hypothetical protein
MTNTDKLVARNHKARAQRAARLNAILDQIAATRGCVVIASRKYNGGAATLRAAR